MSELHYTSRLPRKVVTVSRSVRGVRISLAPCDHIIDLPAGDPVELFTHRTCPRCLEGEPWSRPRLGVALNLSRFRWWLALRIAEAESNVHTSGQPERFGARLEALRDVEAALEERAS